MPSKFIDGECRSCHSTMVRETKHGIMCFCCGMGQYEMDAIMRAAADKEVVFRLAGREWGINSDILPRINTPGETLSTICTNKQLLNEVGINIEQALPIWELLESEKED